MKEGRAHERTTAVFCSLDSTDRLPIALRNTPIMASVACVNHARGRPLSGARGNGHLSQVGTLRKAAVMVAC
jgi:hypothetical protein